MVKELFQDLIVGIVFKDSGLRTSILTTKEAKIKERLKEMRGTS